MHIVFAATRVRIIALSLVVIAVTAGSAAAQSAPNREGFTLLVNLGIGVQHDAGLEETGGGLAGANLGLGGFVTPNLAIMGRYSGTNALYDEPFDDLWQISGVWGPTVQYWPNDRVNVEAGAGVGVWAAEGESDRGFGLIVAVGFTVFNRGQAQSASGR